MHIFDDNDIAFFLQSPEVLSAHEYFTITLPSNIQQKLFDAFGILLETVPMRWITGDSQPHVDVGMSAFDNTYLVYLTDSPGQFIVENESYPIRRGDGFVFKEGVRHGTVDTGSEPRLLLGPMSEAGFAVGYAGIYANGGTTVYVKQESGSLYYSTDQMSSWNNLYLPSYVNNSNTGAGYLTVQFITDITLTSTNDYFICNSDYIQFGSNNLKTDGTRPVFTVTAGSYDGLITNGESGFNGYSNIRVVNLVVNGTSTQISGGFLCKTYFGKGATNNSVINCSTSGDIYGGGLFGSYAGNNGSLRIVNCSSSGSLLQPGAGGIVGAYAGINSGSVIIDSCKTTGALIESYCGGIAGQLSENIQVTNCCSTGVITGSEAGGILGATNNNCSVEKCFSTGSIDGNGAGGICGSLISVSTKTVSVTNCYTTGSISGSNNAGGIFGTVSNISLLISNCYIAGSTSGSKGYIIGNKTNGDTNFSGSGFVISSCYSEAFRGSSGFSSAHANSVLVGVGSVWIQAGIGPYLLYGVGYTPYVVSIISGNSMVKTTVVSLVRGNTTNAAIVGSSFSLIDNGETGITINASTGAITADVAPGVYSLKVQNAENSIGNSVSYVTLTVLDIPLATARSPRFLQLFTDNSRVYYKRGSNAFCGVGSVRNYRTKGFKT